MKKITLLFLLSISNYLFSQTEKFTFNSDGNSDYVVIKVDGFKSKDIYTKSLNWINVNYKNPEKVIKGKVESEMIRIEGFDSSAFSRTTNSGNKFFYGIHYTLEIEIQDGKYRIKYSANDITTDDGKKVYFSLLDVLNNKTDQNGNSWNGSKNELENNIQKLIDSHKNYIIKQKNDW